MIQNPSAVAAQGAVAVQAPVRTFFNAFAQSFAKQNRRSRPFRPLLLLLVVTEIFATDTNAQSPDTLTIQTLGYQISAPNVTLNAGETATLELEAGTSTDPVSNAYSFSIDLELGEDAAFPTEDDVTFDGSWFFSGVTPVTSVSLNAGNHSLTVEGSRTTAQTGSGKVFQIKLKAARSGIHAADLIKTAGGIITVEDAGFKRSPTAGTLTANTALADCYPNPFKDKLYFDWHGSRPEKVLLYDLSGNIVQTLSQDDIETGKVLTNKLKPGLYLVVIQYKPQTQCIKKVFKK